MVAVGCVHALLLLLHNEACGVPHSRLVASALQVLQTLLSAGSDIQVSTSESTCVAAAIAPKTLRSMCSSQPLLDALHCWVRCIALQHQVG